ncbi:HAD family phosphatase [Candidatus Saccharibacteria bacterium CPR2]|nr:HAD family phosphatase [Candidatus Saccharibacteria bacterium CPR2]
MRKYKALIFDIDGTAINSPSQKVPSERLVQAIRKLEEDYYACAATGRVWTFAEPVLKGLSLVDPCIISAGTQICNPVTGEIMWQCDIDEADLAATLAIAKKYPKYKVLYNDNDEDAYLNGGLDVANLQITEPVYFFELIFVPQEIAPQIVAELSKIDGVAVTLVVAQRAGFNDIHVTNRNATKEHAIAELLKILKIKQEDTIGVGDGHNDIHLFNAVKHKVAMGNAVDELKAASNEVIGLVTEDGFSEYIERLSDVRA